MLGTVVLDQQVCLFKLHPTSVHICSTSIRPAAQPSLPQGRQIYHYACLIMWHRTSTHVCNQAVFFCNSFTRLAGLLQHPCLLTLLKQQTCLLQLHPATWHVSYNCTLPACISVRIASHQQICFYQLQLTCKHICMIRIYHNYKLQTTLRYREEEPYNNHETPGRQTK